MAPIPSMPGPQPLSHAQSHRAFVVSRIDLPEPEGLRVKVMGICVGRPLNIVRSGDPLIVNVAGANVVISRELADSILVNPVLPVNGAARAIS